MKRQAPAREPADAQVLIACPADKVAKDKIAPLAQGIVEWHNALKPVADVTCVSRDCAFAKTNLAPILQQNVLTNVRSL